MNISGCLPFLKVGEINSDLDGDHVINSSIDGAYNFSRNRKFCDWKANYRMFNLLNLISIFECFVQNFISFVSFESYKIVKCGIVIVSFE